MGLIDHASPIENHMVAIRKGIKSLTFIIRESGGNINEQFQSQPRQLTLPQGQSITVKQALTALCYAFYFFCQARLLLTFEILFSMLF